MPNAFDDYLKKQTAKPRAIPVKKGRIRGSQALIVSTSPVIYAFHALKTPT